MKRTKTAALLAKHDSIIRVDVATARRASLALRILTKTGPSEGQHGCQLWQGSISTSNGYPKVWGADPETGETKLFRVSRVILSHMMRRPLKKSELALHNPALCSQHRACVNPDHLYCGSSKQNESDRKAAGSNKGRKLSADKAREICSRRDAGEGLLELAQEFGVKPQAICCVVNGITWSKATGRVHIAKQPGLKAPALQATASTQLGAVA